MASKVRLCKGHNAPLLKCVGDVSKLNFTIVGQISLMGKFLIVKNVYKRYLNIIKMKLIQKKQPHILL